MRKLNKNDIKVIISIMTIIFSFSIFLMLFFMPIPADNKDLINILAMAIIVNSISRINNNYFATNNENKDNETTN